MYINKSICKKCQGQCCKLSGCMLSTRNVKGDMKTELEKLIKNKDICIYKISFNCFMIFCFGPFIENLFLPSEVKVDVDRAQKLRIHDDIFLVKIRSIKQEVFYTLDNCNEIDYISNSGPCIHLREEGCKYSDTERPYGGLSLKPDERGIKYCKSDFNVLDAALEWFEYHSVLEEFFNKYNNS